MFKKLFRNNKLLVLGGLLATAVAGLGGVYKGRLDSSQIKPNIQPEGNPKDATTLLLESGSKIFQSNDPVKGHDVYLVGFHPMKEDPYHQMEAHHYCKQVNEDFAQCLLFDGNTKHANLTGLEYIISEKLFSQLPEEERQYWHPHNYEISSGQLVAPGLPTIAERILMQKKVNSYGKTYHTWRAKCWEGEKPYLDTLPKGPAILAWSFNHDDEVKPELIETRDKNMNINTQKKNQERRSFMDMYRPQEGAD